MDIDHVVKLCVRGIDVKIPTILQYGVIYPHPENKRRYMCVHKESDNEYITLVFIPVRNSNIIITGFPSKPEEKEMFEKIKGEN